MNLFISVHARNPPSIQLSSLEQQQALETVLKMQRLGQRLGSQMPSPFLGPTRPMSLDFSMFDDGMFYVFFYLFCYDCNAVEIVLESKCFLLLLRDSRFRTPCKFYTKYFLTEVKSEIVNK